MADDRINIDINARGSGFDKVKKDIDGTKKGIGSLAKEAEKTLNELKKLKGGLDELGKKTSEAGRESDKTSKKQGELASKLNNVKNEVEQTSNVYRTLSKQLDKQGKVVGIVEKKLTQYKNTQGEVIRVTENLTHTEGEALRTALLRTTNIDKETQALNEFIATQLRGTAVNEKAIQNIQRQTSAHMIHADMTKQEIGAYSQLIQKQLQQAGVSDKVAQQISEETQARLLNVQAMKQQVGVSQQEIAGNLNKGILGRGWDRLKSVNDSLNQIRWTFVNWGFAILGAATAIGGLLKMVTDFELKIDRISVITDKASKDIIKSLREVRQNSLFSIDEVADAYTEFVKLGFSADQGLAAMKPIIDLSIAGFSDLATSTRMVGQVMNQFNISVEEASRVADVLARGANASAAEVESFGDALSYVGNQAAIAGLSLEETSAIIAELTNAGMSGSRAGTSLRASLVKLANPTQEVVDMMDALNVSFYDSKGNMKDMDNIIRDLSDSLSGYSQASQDMFLAEAFGTRGGAAIYTLINQYRLTGESIDDIVKSFEEMQSASEVSSEVMERGAARAKNLWNEVTSDFKSNLTEMFISLGNFMADAKGVFDEIERWDANILINYSLTGIPSDEIERMAKNDAERFRKTYDEVLAERTQFSAGQEFASFALLGPLGKPFEWLVEWMNRVYQTSGLVQAGFGLITTAGQKMASVIGAVNNAFKYLVTNIIKMDPVLGGIIKYKDEIGDFFSPAIEKANEYIDKLKEVNKNTEFYQEVQSRLGDQNIALSGVEALAPNIQNAEESLRLLKTTIGATEEYENLYDELFRLTNQYTELREQIYDGTITQDQYKEKVGELEKELQDYNTTLTEHGQTITLATGKLKDFLVEWEKFEFGEETAEINELNREYLSLAENIGMLIPWGGKNVEITKEMIDTWYQGKRAAIDFSEGIDEIQEAFSKYDTVLGEAIDVGEEKLDSFEEKMDSIRENIDRLFDMPFSGQLADERELFELEQQIKMQELRILQMGDAAEDTTDKLKDTKDEYKAWVDTIKTFIRSTLQEGRDLGKDVTDIVKKFQTKLLGTSLFDDDRREAKSPEEQRLEELEKQYDIMRLTFETTYGRMREELELWDREQEYANSNFYSNVEQVKNAIRNQRGELNNVQKDYDSWARRIDNLRAESDELRKAMFGLEHGIDITGKTGKTAFEILVEKAQDYKAELQKLINKQKELNNETGSEPPTYNPPSTPDDDGGSSGGGGSGGSDDDEIPWTPVPDDDEIPWTPVPDEDYGYTPAPDEDLGYTPAPDFGSGSFDGGGYTGGWSSGSSSYSPATEEVEEEPQSMLSWLADFYDDKDDSSSSSSSYSGTSSYAGSTPVKTKAPTGSSLLSEIASMYNDFIFRPGQDPIRVSPQDTIVGFKEKNLPRINTSSMATERDIDSPYGTGSGSRQVTVNFGSINISAPTDRPLSASKIQYMLSELIRKELSTVRL